MSQSSATKHEPLSLSVSPPAKTVRGCTWTLVTHPGHIGIGKVVVLVMAWSGWFGGRLGMISKEGRSRWADYGSLTLRAWHVPCSSSELCQLNIICRSSYMMAWWLRGEVKLKHLCFFLEDLVTTPPQNAACWHHSIALTGGRLRLRHKYTCARGIVCVYILYPHYIPQCSQRHVYILSYWGWSRMIKFHNKYKMEQLVLLFR